MARVRGWKSSNRLPLGKRELEVSQSREACDRNRVMTHPITDGHDAGINSPRRMGLRTGSACILVIPPALAQFWRFARRYVGPALERAAFPGYALLLNDGRYALLRNAEAAQRIAGEAERQLRSEEHTSEL